MQHRLEGIIGEAVSSPNTLKAVAEKRPHRRTRFKSNIKWLKQYKFSLTWWVSKNNGAKSDTVPGCEYSWEHSSWVHVLISSSYPVSCETRALSLFLIPILVPREFCTVSLSISWLTRAPQFPFKDGALFCSLSFISHRSSFVLYPCEVRARDFLLLSLRSYTLASEITTILYTSNRKKMYSFRAKPPSRLFVPREFAPFAIPFSRREFQEKK